MLTFGKILVSETGEKTETSHCSRYSALMCLHMINSLYSHVLFKFSDDRIGNLYDWDAIRDLSCKSIVREVKLK